MRPGPAAEHCHWMAGTIFAGARSGKGRLLQYQHFPSIKFDLQVQAALIQLWKRKRAANRTTWEMTDVFSCAAKSLAKTHLHTVKMKPFVVLTSSRVSLNPLSTPEWSYHRTLLCHFSKTQVCFPLGSHVSAGVGHPRLSGKVPISCWATSQDARTWTDRPRKSWG